MSKPRHIADVRALAHRALGAGATIPRIGVVAWDVSGNCSNPSVMSHTGREAGGRYWSDLEEGGSDAWMTAKNIVVLGERSFYVDRSGKRKSGHKGSAPMWVDITVRCRKCPNCLRTRARQWAMRAKTEIAASSRTWFGTLTMTPSEHHLAFSRAIVMYKDSTGIDLERADSDVQFKERVKALTPEVTRWLKRLRKNSGAKLRYILVAEAHKNGLPHFHILVHEAHGSGMVKHAQLAEAWNLGFTRFKLVENTGSAWYVCKYLSKSALSRVRASVGYGKTTLVIDESRENHPQKGGEIKKSIF